MRNNTNKNNNPQTAARTPAARQGAAANISFAERREKAVIRLPEERRKGTKYQVIRGQYLMQANKKENADSTNAAAKREEEQEKAKRQTMAAKTDKDEKAKSKTSSAKNVSHESNATSEAKDEYAKSEKAAEYAERLQTNIDLSKAVNIPPPVTWGQVLDHSVQKDSVYAQGGSAGERAASYKEKASFYLDKMKKNTETGQKEINPNRDKDIGELYKKAYKLAHKEELLEKKDDTAYDKVQSAIQLKSELDNALDKDNTGEAVVAVAAIPLTHAAKKAIRKSSLELASKVTAEVAAADGVGEATANAVAAVPKYIVQKKVEKTVQQVMQNQHDRKIAAQRERLRQQQEKVEKRAQQIKKENMQRNMKVDLYKSEHGMGLNGNVLQKIKAAIKSAIEAMKRAISFFKSSGMMLMAAAGGALIPIITVALVAVVLLLVFFPFLYTSKDGKEENIEDSTFGETISHYYAVMDEVVDNANEEIRVFVSSHRPKPNMHSYRIVWESPEIKKLPFVIPLSPDQIPKDKIPKSIIYDEILCTIATYNQKLMTSPDNSDLIFMNDENVAAVYNDTYNNGEKFWKLTYRDICLGFCGDGCPGHFETRYKLTFDFDIERVWEKYGFDDEDKENYNEVKEEFDKEKEKAGIT